MLPAPSRRPLTFSGRTTFRHCPVKDCAQLPTEQHHILYAEAHGKNLTRDLCHEHHLWITRAQSHQVHKQRSVLSGKQRWFFWFELVNGEMKRPRRTHLDHEWEKRWEVERRATNRTALNVKPSQT